LAIISISQFPIDASSDIAQILPSGFVQLFGGRRG
jgi:hypothetical protein